VISFCGSISIVSSICPQIAALTEDIITNTPCYKLLAEQAAQHAHDEKAAREELSRVQNEFSQLQENRRQWQEEFTVRKPFAALLNHPKREKLIYFRLPHPKKLRTLS
jgi:flagellar motility protein MotE (MotC chaperone)